MKKIILFSLTCIIILIAVFTNPKKEIHIENLSSKLSKEFFKDIPQNYDNTLTHVLGNFLINSEIEKFVEYNNYVFFSTTSSEKGTLSIGLFGNVFSTFKYESETNNRTSTKKIYEGYIDGKYPITMTITMLDEKITGDFHYNKFKKNIRLEGKLIGNTITLNGYDENDKLIDIFSGKLDNKKIIGKWSDGNQNKNFDFQLNLISEEFENENEKNNHSKNNQISINSIRTGYGAMSKGWRPAILVNVKNTSNQDIKEFIKIKAIFIDTETNKELGVANKYVSSNSNPFLSGLNKDILLYPSISYKGSPSSLRIKAKIYIDDVYIKDIELEPTELY